MYMSKKFFFLSALALLISGQLFAGTSANSKLTFNSAKYEKQVLTYNGQTIKVRAYEKIVYVANPVEKGYEIMNIYVPEEYFNGGSINGYTAKNAPIFLPNQIGGYMPAAPATAKEQPMEMPAGMRRPDMGAKPQGAPMGAMNFPKRENVVLAALSQGYVVASPGARGRTSATGKAPAALVDLKAAVRYLKFNDAAMPGDANRIISSGTSAGGAMSSLLGATGNNPDYEPFLKAIGAADATDDIFAVQAYCPITNLDHADMAYEWQFNGVNNAKGRAMPGQSASDISLTEAQIKASAELKSQFPAYLNSLNLKDFKGNPLSLDENGEGSFKEWVKSFVVASAQKELDKGTDLSSYSWLKIENGKAVSIDFDQYVRYMTRQKLPPAFDAFDLSTPENQEFGTSKIDKQHFTAYSMQHATTSGATLAESNYIKMMNPLNYIGTSNTTTSKYWRIRHGSYDKDTGLAICIILGTRLQNLGYDVNLALPWNKPHSGDYDLDELFDWIDGLCK